MTRPLRIIVIEDYDARRQAICDVLIQDGHTAIGFPMAEDVDDEPTGFVSDLYIIDVNLPGEDGLSLSRRIRRSHPDVGIVIVSARTGVDDRIGGYQSGGNIYLTKPLSLEELRAVVASFGQRFVNHLNSTNAGLVLNSVTMVLQGPTGEARLTQAETMLLSAFSRAPQNELEHWQVASHLKQGGDISKDNVEVKIGRLRRKLISAGVESPAIRSIRGVGYRLLNAITLIS